MKSVLKVKKQKKKKGRLKDRLKMLTNNLNLLVHS